MGVAYGRLWTLEAWKRGFIQLLVLRGILAVAVTEVRLLSDSNQNQYVLHGEGATLTCHYLLEPNERVTEVEWEKDGVLVYFWTIDSSPQPQAMDVLEGHVDLSVNSPSTIVITSAQMDMQGTYSCRVRTNGKTAHNEAFVMVIVDACKESSWQTHSDRVKCEESVALHCSGMFPKPSPSCGAYSKGRFLTSVPFDSVHKLWNKTYELSLHRKFKFTDWKDYPDIAFRCHLVVMGTPWRSGIHHKMFGEPGCPEEDLPVILQGHFNVSVERSCWDHPVEGSEVEYHCDEGLNLQGPSSYICENSEWKPKGSVSDTKVENLVCSGSSDFSNRLHTYVLIITLLFISQLGRLT